MHFSRNVNHKRVYNYTPLNSSFRRRKSRRKAMVTLLFFLIGVTALSVFSVRIFLKKIVAYENKVMNAVVENIFQPDESQPAELKAAVDKVLNGTTGTYGIAIKNLKTNEEYFHNEHRKFPSASLYKLWVMATVMEDIQNGKLSENTPLKQDVKVLNDKFGLASEEAEMTEGTIEMTVGVALNKMITVSHNYAAMLLYERVGYKHITSFLAEHGFLESNIGRPPMTTAADIVLFYEKLYDGELADEVHTTKMIDLLKKQQINLALPKYLPEGTIVAHKTGDLNKIAHDAGIVYTEKGDYLIVTLSESLDTPGAKDRMAQISQAVYDYFTL